MNLSRTCQSKAGRTRVYSSEEKGRGLGYNEQRQNYRPSVRSRGLETTLCTEDPPWSLFSTPKRVTSRRSLSLSFPLLLNLNFDQRTSAVFNETVKTVTDFIFLGSKITTDSDCSHDIKRRLLLGRKAMTNLDSILKSRDIILLTQIHLIKAMVFPVVTYGCDSWTIKKAEYQGIDVFKL